MASIDKRPNGSYRARWREFPGGPQKTKHFVRKIDAQKFLAALEGDLVRGMYVDPRLGQTLFRDFVKTWQRSQVHRPTTEAQVTTYLNRHLLPTFGDRPLASITTSQVQGWVRAKSIDLSPGYVTCMYRYLGSIFRAAVSDRMIARSPCEGIKLPRDRRPEVSPLTVEQVRSVSVAIDNRYQAAVLVAAGLGLRWGECFGLTVDRVNFLGRSVLIDRQVARIGGDDNGLAPPKTEASYRTIPLPSVVAESLASHLKAHPVLDEPGLIFLGPKGSPMKQASWRYIWNNAVAKAKAPSNTRFHDLRHFYASSLIRAGESVKVVQSRLGHESAAVTLNIYGHLWPEDDDRTRAAIDAAFGSAEDQLRTEEAG